LKTEEDDLITGCEVVISVRGFETWHELLTALLRRKWPSRKQKRRVSTPESAACWHCPM